MQKEESIKSSHHSLSYQTRYSFETEPLVLSQCSSRSTSPQKRRSTSPQRISYPPHNIFYNKTNSHKEANVDSPLNQYQGEGPHSYHRQSQCLHFFQPHHERSSSLDQSERTLLLPLKLSNSSTLQSGHSNTIPTKTTVYSSFSFQDEGCTILPESSSLLYEAPGTSSAGSELSRLSLSSFWLEHKGWERRIAIWTDHMWKRFLLFSILPSFLVLIWVAIPFPHTKSEQEEHSPSSPLLPPSSTSFLFYLFFYFSILNIFRLILISRLFTLYKLSWTPHSYSTWFSILCIHGISLCLGGIAHWIGWSQYSLTWVAIGGFGEGILVFCGWWKVWRQGYGKWISFNSSTEKNQILFEEVENWNNEHENYEKDNSGNWKRFLWFCVVLCKISNSFSYFFGFFLYLHYRIISF